MSDEISDDWVREHITEYLIPEIEAYDFLKGINIIDFLQNIENSLSGNIIDPTAFIHEKAIVKNCIIGSGVEIYEGCTIRDSVICDKVVIGHSSEVARSIILKECMIPRFNYVGCSLLGERVRLGGFVMFATRRHDDQNAKIIFDKRVIQTSNWKIGAIVGSDVIIGYGTHVNPGCTIGHHSVIGTHIDLKKSLKPKTMLKIKQEMLECSGFTIS